MECFNVFIGQPTNLCLLMHNDINGFQFKIFNEDKTNYDFSGLTDLFLKIYEPGSELRSKLLVTIAQGDPGVDVSGNIITWNSKYTDDIKIFVSKTYYYELSWKDADNDLITVSFNDLIIK